MKTVISMRCPFCGKYHEVEVKESEYYAWLGGEFIQNAMPGLSTSQREQLISHLCPTCQDNIFDMRD